MRNVLPSPPSTERRLFVDRYFEAGVFLFAVAIRIAAIVALFGLSTAPEIGSDDEEYDAYAWNVSQGRGYRGPSIGVVDQDHLTAYRPPVPSLFTFLALLLAYFVLRLSSSL